MTYWVEKGVKGIRADAAGHASHEALQAMHDRLEELRPQYGFIPIIGEVWMGGVKKEDTVHMGLRNVDRYVNGDPAAPFKEYQGELDGFLDFKFHQIAAAVANGSMLEEDARNYLLEQHYPAFSDKLLVSMLSSYDMNQFLSYTNKYEFKRAASLQMIMPQPAIIKAGEERGMTHWSPMEAHSSHGDLEVRQPVDWNWADPDIMNHYLKITQNRAMLRNIHDAVGHYTPAHTRAA
jgi:glycosidase